MISCLKCDKEITLMFDHPTMPKDAILFSSYGNYGSTVYDSFGDEQLEVYVCDDCVKSNASKFSVVKEIVKSPEYTRQEFTP